MPLDTKPIDAITEADLQALIADKAAEQQTIDYKRGISLDGDKPRDEFRADVTSFANTVGGHIVIGMDEANGFPTALGGFDVPNPDRFKLRLSEILQSKISPRVPAVGIAVVPLANGKHAAIVRIPRSFAKPHQITASGKDDFQFWARNAAGKYRLAVDELRSVMVQSETIAERMRQFRMDRIAAVASGDTPVPIVAGAKMILHLVPFDAFEPAVQRDLSQMRNAPLHNFIVTLKGARDGFPASRSRHNVDGYFGFDDGNRSADAESYIQVFRSGIIEYVDACWLEPVPGSSDPLWRVAGEKALVSGAARGLELLSDLGVQSPVAILLSMTSASSCRVHVGHWMSPLSEPFGRDVILFPDVVFDDPTNDVGTVLHPILDAIWNAGGAEFCPNYDENGKWRERPR